MVIGGGQLEDVQPKLDTMESLMYERQMLANKISTEKKHLFIVEENIRALNKQILNLEKQLIRKHYDEECLT